MTGPQYPPPPGAGSNGIGLFEIGVSPLGDISQFDVWNTVLSQYANSPILTGLIESWVAALDQTQDFDAFYDNIWNVLTAQGYGLDIWGLIVGVNRVIHVPIVTFFGFAEALPGVLSFQPLSGSGGGCFYSGQPVTSNYALSDEAYRLLILAKARSNISDGSIPSINEILMKLFPGRGNAYVTDGYQGAIYFGFAEAGSGVSGFNQQAFYNGETIGTMKMTYTFDYQLSPVELAIVQGAGVLPKPTGVAASVVIR